MYTYRDVAVEGGGMDVMTFQRVTEGLDPGYPDQYISRYIIQDLGNISVAYEEALAQPGRLQQADALAKHLIINQEAWPSHPCKLFVHLEEMVTGACAAWYRRIRTADSPAKAFRVLFAGELVQVAERDEYGQFPPAYIEHTASAAEMAAINTVASILVKWTNPGGPASPDSPQ